MRTEPTTQAIELLDLRELREERDFLLASLRDLEDEHKFGDIDELDYEALSAKYTARAAEVLRAIEAAEDSVAEDSVAEDSPAEHSVAEDSADEAESLTGKPDLHAEPQKSKRWKRRKWFLVAGVAAMVIAASIFILVVNTGVRLPGTSATGSITLSKQQEIARTVDQAEVLDSEGQLDTALELFDTVLQEDPDQPVALSEAGRLEFASGISAKNTALALSGESEELKAASVDPNWWAPRLYLGSMYLTENEPSQAVAEYSQMLNDSAPASELKIATPYIDKAYSEDGLKPPPI